MPVDAARYLASVPSVPPEEVERLFKKYKDHLVGESDAEGYTLGYKSPDRVKIDFLFWDTRRQGPTLRNFMDREYVIEHPRRFFEDLGTVEFRVGQ